MNVEKTFTTSETPHTEPERPENAELSFQELLDVHEEIFKSGQPMLVNETWEEYGTRVNTLWESEKEGIIQRIAVPGITPSTYKQETQTPQQHPVIESDKSKITNTSEAYLDLPNVNLCRENILTLLQTHRHDANLAQTVKSALYEMLTRRRAFVESTTMAGKDVAEVMSAYGPQMKWYTQTREAVQSQTNQDTGMSWNNNPGWFGIHTRPEVPRREGPNIKVYATLPVSEYTALQYMPELAQNLRTLAHESDDVIQVKMPNGLAGFLANNDSVVIHFKKSENADRVREVLQQWMTQHNLHEEPREMGRTTLAVDSKESSFSDLVAESIAEGLIKNCKETKSDGTDAYSPEALATWAVKYAIELSQKAPNIMDTT